MVKIFRNILNKQKSEVSVTAVTQPIVSVQKYYTLDLPFGVFKRALIDKDLTQVENFDNIFMDYCISIGGDELSNKLIKEKEITYLEERFVIGSGCISILRSSIETDKKRFPFNKLKSMRYQHSIDEFSEENCIKLCNQVEGLVKLDGLKIQMKELEKKNDEKQTPVVKKTEYTHDYFARLVAEFMSTIHVTITDETNTRIFCQAANMYKNYIEIKKNQHANSN